MKFFKWLAIGLVSLVVVLFAGGAALVYLVDWNNFRDTIQTQVKNQTGRDLTIAGDLKPTVFPFIGVSLGEISFANANGFGDTPFAKMGSANVKVKLLPLLKKEVNIKTVELRGLTLDLQRAADGSTNWDDLAKGSGEQSEVEDADDQASSDGSSPIAALEVGGIEISDANVSWSDAQSGTDAKLADFNLTTGAISLAKPFDLKTNFKLSSNSMALAADVNGAGRVMADLSNQLYTLEGFTLTTDAVGDSLPGGKLVAILAASIAANMDKQTVDVSPLTLDALGISLKGAINARNLDTDPAVTGKLSSDEFSPLDIFQKLGIEAPVTADPAVLTNASLTLALDATAKSANLNDLTIRLDDTTFTGNASLPSLEAEVPPLRFQFAVDTIDLDRYFPPVEEAVATGDSDVSVASDATGDEPIELPLDMMRKLDIDGKFNVGNVKVKNLTTTDISVPLLAKDGLISLAGLSANLYQGRIDSTVRIDARADTPAYAFDFNLNGIQADPLLTDFLKKTSFISGAGLVAANITTSGNTVNSITAALNGDVNTSFTDGFIRGVNLGYQIRRARAAFSGQSLSVDESQVKTDFTALSVSAQLVNGVVQSNDLDMRSPLLRVSGGGQVDVPAEQVDYTLTTLITGSSQGQGGKDLEALKGVKLNVPIRGSFDDLSADFAGIILAGMKENITENFKSQAAAKAKAEAEKLKQEAQAKLQAEEQRVRERLAVEEEKARAKLAAERARAEEKINEQKAQLEEKAADLVKDNKKKVEGALKNLFK